MGPPARGEEQARPDAPPQETTDLPGAASVPVPVKPGWRQALVAFHHRNFSILWVGALLSNSGTWVQNTVVPFVVYSVTQNPSLPQVAVFLQLIPMVVMAPLGGAIADRFERRRVLIVSQAAMAGVAVAMWAVWVYADGSIPAIFALLFVGGVIAGLNIPSWQAFVSELVPREALLSAVTLNSTQFNASRLFGPTLGGIVLGTLGAAWAFTINAWSFVAVIVALLLVRVPRLAVTRVPRHERPGVLREFFDAARGVRRYPGIRACFVAVVALGIAQGPLLGLLPVFTKEVFGVADLYYGLLVGALGLGAIVAAPLVAGRGSALPKGRLTLVGMTAYSLALVALGLSPVYLFAFLALVVAGMAYLSLASTLNTTIQVQVEEAIRGKVLALYVMLLTTAIPVGALIGAGLVHVVGPRGVVMLCGTFFLLVALWLWRGNDWLAHMDDDGPLPEVAVA